MMEDSSMLWVFGLLAMLTLLILVVAWPVTGIVRARLAVSREEQYRQLAERAVLAQEASNDRLAGISSELAGMRTHMASLERVLTEVQ